MMNQHLYIVLIMLYDPLKCYIQICSHTLHACAALGKVWSSQTQTNEWPALPPELQQHIYDRKHLKSVRKSPLTGSSTWQSNILH